MLLNKGVEEGKILFLSLIAAPEGVHKICGQYPRVKVVTTEIDEGIAPDFQVIPGTNLSSRHWCYATLHYLCQASHCHPWLAGVGEFGDRYFCD